MDLAKRWQCWRGIGERKLGSASNLAAEIETEEEEARTDSKSTSPISPARTESQPH